MLDENARLTDFGAVLRTLVSLARKSRVLCPQCGGDDVEHAEWYAPNRDTLNPGMWEGVTMDHAAERGLTFCNDCNDHTALVWVEDPKPVVRFEAYQDGNAKRTKRCWSVFENDGTTDGRCVGSGMIDHDAHAIARLLNGSQP